MQGSIPQTYSIADFIEWQRRKQLILDPSFQRGSVWTQAAKLFLIDTILNRLPVPQIYLRTRINPQTQSTMREVVDGQQRLRSILEFASGSIKFGNKAKQFAGLDFQNLEVDQKEAFLSFPLTTIQLINASDADVLEVFSRLNSYNVKVTPAELRHAKYDEPIKWAIWNATREWAILWDIYKVITVRECLRQKNTSFMAELFMIASVGFSDGGERPIDKYYNSNKDKSESYFYDIRQVVDKNIEFIIGNFSALLAGSTFFDSPNFLALFAAIEFLNGRLPKGRSTVDIDRLAGVGVDLINGGQELLLMQAAIDNDDLEGRYGKFISATKSSTQTLASRKVRLEFLVRALAKSATN